MYDILESIKDRINKNDKILLWGAGKEGKNYYNILNNNGYNVFCWVDKFPEKYDSDVIFNSKDAVKYINYVDHIIIAAQKTSIRESIKKDIIQLGKFENKIIIPNVEMLKYNFIYENTSLMNIYSWRLYKIAQNVEHIEAFENELLWMKTNYELIKENGSIERPI